jgi:hypothetical protein
MEVVSAVGERLIRPATDFTLLCKGMRGERSSRDGRDVRRVTPLGSGQIRMKVASFFGGGGLWRCFRRHSRSIRRTVPRTLAPFRPGRSLGSPAGVGRRPDGFGKTWPTSRNRLELRPTTCLPRRGASAPEGPPAPVLFLTTGRFQTRSSVLPGDRASIGARRVVDSPDRRRSAARCDCSPAAWLAGTLVESPRTGRHCQGRHCQDRHCQGRHCQDRQFRRATRSPSFLRPSAVLAL